MAEMWSGSEEGSYFRLIDCCITLNSRLESNKEGKKRTPSPETHALNANRASGAPILYLELCYCNPNGTTRPPRDKPFLIDNLLVRIHCVIEMFLTHRPCVMGG